MSRAGCGVWTITTLLVAALTLVIALQFPARADGASCNRTPPKEADQQDAAAPAVLHRCPKVATRQSHETFLTHGFVPFMDDEAAATASVLRILSESCASGSARIDSIMFRPKDKGGERLLAYAVAAECL